jgi:hypothetical protein
MLEYERWHAPYAFIDDNDVSNNTISNTSNSPTRSLEQAASIPALVRLICLHVPLSKLFINIICFYFTYLFLCLLYIWCAGFWPSVLSVTRRQFVYSFYIYCTYSYRWHSQRVFLMLLPATLQRSLQKNGPYPITFAERFGMHFGSTFLLFIRDS